MSNSGSCTTSVIDLQINEPDGSKCATICVSVRSPLNPPVEWYTEISQNHFLSCCYELAVATDRARWALLTKYNELLLWRSWLSAVQLHGVKPLEIFLSRRVRVPKVTVSFIMSACLSTYIRAAPTKWIFVKIRIWNF